MNNILLLDRCEDFDDQGSEWFKYQVTTPHGVEERYLSLKTIDGILCEEIETYINIEQSELVEHVFEDINELDLKEAYIKSFRTNTNWNDDYFLHLEIGGFRKLFKTDLVAELKRQIPNLEESRKKADLEKVRLAKENYEKLRLLYGDV